MNNAIYFTGLSALSIVCAYRLSLNKAALHLARKILGEPSESEVVADLVEQGSSEAAAKQSVAREPFTNRALHKMQSAVMPPYLGPLSLLVDGSALLGLLYGFWQFGWIAIFIVIGFILGTTVLQRVIIPREESEHFSTSFCTR